MQKHIIANYILTITAIILIIISIVLIYKNKNSDPVSPVSETENNTTGDAVEVDGEQEVETGISVNEETTNNQTLVTPPAPGIFSKDAVRDFTSDYDTATRIFTFNAQVMRRFFFEANAPVALYDQQGNLIELKGATTTGDVYAEGNDFVPLRFTFSLPQDELPTQQFVVRIMMDDPSGGEGGTPLYWGTVVRGK